MIPESLVSPDNIEAMIWMAGLTPPGAFIEVGVYKGGTAYHLDKLASAQARPCILCDTFEGIPYAGEHDKDHKVGDFSNGLTYEEAYRMFPESYVVKGIFPASLKNINIPFIAFAHLDCDQYQSIKDSVKYLSPHMVAGGIMWFDDSPILEGAEKAVRECFTDDRIEIYNGKHFVKF